MVTVNVPLDTGAEYEVIKTFDTFLQHRRYTYVGFISFYDDRTIAGYELFFIMLKMINYTLAGFL